MLSVIYKHYMLSVVMLNVLMLSVLMLSAIMLSVITLNVVALNKHVPVEKTLGTYYKFHTCLHFLMAVHLNFNKE